VELIKRGMKPSHVVLLSATLLLTQVFRGNCATEDQRQKKFRFKNGTSLSEEDLIGIFSAHRKKAREGDWLNLDGADLRGIVLWRILHDAERAPGAGALQLERTNFNGANLRGADLQGITFEWCDFSGTNLANADFRGAKFENTEFIKADLTRAQLHAISLSPGSKTLNSHLEYTIWSEGHLDSCDFLGGSLSDAIFGRSIDTDEFFSIVRKPATLRGATFLGRSPILLEPNNDERLPLQRANFIGCDLKESQFLLVDATSANFSEADLSGALIEDAILTDASFINSNLDGTKLEHAKLQGATFEPQPKKLPYLPLLASADGLDKLRYENSPSGLTELRAAFKDAGMRDQERQVSYALLHTRLEKARAQGKWLEYWFNRLLFDLPCKYGLDPGRPLLILVGAIFVFMIPYVLGIVFREHARQSGIWVVRNDNTVHRIERTRAIAVRTPRLTADAFSGRLRQRMVQVTRALGTALYFSLLSAFSIGFREINVGSWISRLQSREYTLRATGWLRCVAGIQSLLSVYLVALWILTYFGRPFE
jgi:uncharacterized protein YjbI with pentapeptide repeats